MSEAPNHSDYEPVWLVDEGRVLASAARTVTRRARRRGLIGRGSMVEPLVIQPCRWVHTVGMRTAIDVAYLDAAGTVVRVESLRSWRVSAPVFRARTVIEAERGSFERWGLHLGDVVEIREVSNVE